MVQMSLKVFFLGLLHHISSLCEVKLQMFLFLILFVSLIFCSESLVLWRLSSSGDCLYIIIFYLPVICDEVSWLLFLFGQCCAVGQVLPASVLVSVELGAGSAGLLLRGTPYGITSWWTCFLVVILFPLLL